MEIAVVVVTYNRRALLQECLNAYTAQTSPPDFIIVVDNASTDGTGEFLQLWEKDVQRHVQKLVVHLPSNVGGSGGFFEGTKAALRTGAEWIWVADDDAVPSLNVLERCRTHLKALDIRNIAAICAKVISNGEVSTPQRYTREKGLLRIRFKDIPKERYMNDSFECDGFGYVGALMNANKLAVSGLIRGDFFIWHDDAEHSIRLSREGKIICYPDMEIVHKVNDIDYKEVTWKSFYGYRNNLLLLRLHYSPRYTIIKAILTLMKALRSKDRQSRDLILASIKAGLKGQRGLDSVYRPGWQK